LIFADAQGEPPCGVASKCLPQPSNPPDRGCVKPSRCRSPPSMAAVAHRPEIITKT
ncbi:hypothetical protein PanWU01x14_032770, partial [Parasponia andersonii]